MPARRKVAVAALALLAACSSGGGADRATTTTAPTTSTSTAPTTTTAPPVSVDATGCAVPRRARPDPWRPRYRLRLDLRPGERLVTGDQTVTFTPDRPTDRLVFRLWVNGPSFTGGSIDPGEVTVDGMVRPTERPDATTLVVPLGRTAPSGRALVASLPWTLHLPDNLNSRVSRAGDTVRMGSFFPLLGWEPGVGWTTEPPTTANAETSTAPTADFDLEINAPPGTQVFATGRQTAPTRWKADAVRDVNVVAGHFRVAEAEAGPVHVAVAVADALPDDPHRFLTPAVAALDDFARRFGPYPWPSYTIAVTPAMRGGIEYPMLVSAGSGSFGRSTPHEVGHMWFYGLVGNDQARDPWVDEGLATWAEARNMGTLASFVAQTIPDDAKGRTGAPMTYWEGRASYYRGVYVQGLQALAALGDPDRVDCALRVFVARNAYRVATTDDLLQALESVFPDARRVVAPYLTGG